MELTFFDFSKQSDSYPVLTASGEDRFFLDRTVQLLKELAGELDLTVLSKPRPEEILSAAELAPFMGRRVVLVYDYAGGEETLDLPFPDESVTAFISPSDTGLIARSRREFCHVSCARAPERMLIAYLNRELKGTGGISEDAALLLIEYTGGFMTRISLEASKLKGLSRAVTAGDIRENVLSDTEYKIYELSDFLAKKRPADAINVLNRLLETEKPAALLTALYTQFRRLLHAAVNRDSDEELGRLLKVNPRAAAVNRRLARNFKPRALMRINEKFHALDLAMKTGGVGDKDALSLMLMKIINEGL